MTSGGGGSFPPISTDSKYKFSKHDNRDALRNSGAYFDLGLGKRRVKGQLNQHRSQDHISWTITFAPSPSATQKNPAQPPCGATPTVDQRLLDKFAAGKCGFRRYPRHHFLPGVTPPTAAVAPEWLGGAPTVTPLWVLAATQGPRPLPHSTWAYSYKQ